MPLATYLATQKARTADHLDLDDLLSAARVGLAQAALSFDASRGVPFSAYASSQIKWSMATEMRRFDPAGERSREKIKKLHVAIEAGTTPDGRRPTIAELVSRTGMDRETVAQHLQLDEMVRTSTSFEEHFAPDTGREAADLIDQVILPEDAAESSERRRMLARIIAALPEQMGIVIRGIYLEDRPLTEIAAQMAVSHPYVSKLRKTALALMGEAMRSWESGEDPDRSTPKRADFFDQVFGANSAPELLAS